MPTQAERGTAPALAAAGGQRARYRRAREWGTTQEMNPLEAMMWRAEGDPRLQMTLVAVEVLDRAPDFERLHAAHEWGSRMVPRFRQRVVEPAFGLGAPVWEVDPEFELDRHLRRVSLAAPGDLRALLDLAGEVAMTPFHRRRPLWEAVLVDGLAGGEAAYILKLHHCITDGLGNVQLLDLIHSDRRAHSRSKPEPPLPVLRAQSGLGLLAGQVARIIRAAPAATLGGAGAAVAGLGHAAGDPGRALVSTARVAATAAQMAGPGPAAPAPLLAGRSLRRHFEGIDASLAQLRGVADVAGASVNDVYLAAVLGGLRRYHEAFGLPVGDVPMAIPVSTRRREDPLGGNRFTGVRFAAPAGEPDPRRRIARVRELVARERHRPALDAIAQLAPLAGLLPGPVVARLAARLTQVSDIQASNVPGVTRRVFMAGAEITRVYPYAPLPGCAATVTMASHNDICCLGASLDPAAFTEPALFAACLRDGLDEVLALGSA